MENFPGNSNKSTEKPKPEKKIEKVVTGEVVKKQKPLGRRFKDIFFGGDFKSAARYLSADVLLPAMRNLIVDAATKGVERIVYGESAVGRRRAPELRSRVQYNNPLIREDPRSRALALQERGISKRAEVGDLILTSREEAELVVERLVDIIDKYDVATVADLYDLVGLPSNYVDNKWGWTSVSGMEVRQVRDGYAIDLPQAEAV